MLDIKVIRENPDRVRELLPLRNGDAAAVDQALALDERRRELVQQADNCKARRNEISKLIPQKAKAKEPIDDLKEESRAIGEQISGFDAELAKIDDQLKDLLMRVPNLPHESVPRGKDESENVVARTWGEKKTFDFEPKGHWELGEDLGILDLPRGAKVSGSGYYTLRGAGSRLERALIQWMLDTHTANNGYTEVSVPFVVNRQSMIGTSQLPKFEEDMYHVKEDDLFLVPTAEVPVTNLHGDEILEADELPISYCAHTPCFRREAGSAGRENRGIARIHQFHKVELVHIVKPEESYAVHEKLTSHATGLLEALGLHYRVLSLCTGDMGFGAAKCYDLELWAPGMNTWLEVSSCSNFEEFQARRANIRYRPEPKAKPQYVHTLNGSGLALPRLMIAILENFQRANGTIEVPAVLRDRMGTDVIK